MESSYSIPLVFLSVAIAVTAAYAMLSLATRLTNASGRNWLVWLAGGSLSMGFGVWAMHFIGMLAFKLPVSVSYDLLITLGSITPAVVGSAVLLYILRRFPTATPGAVAISSVMLGSGIGAMHYCGMSAMRIMPAITYEPWRVLLSIVVAVVLSAIGTRMAIRVVRADSGWRKRMATAGVIGLAVAVMHYVGMWAARFDAHSMAYSGEQGIPSVMLIAAISFAALVVLVFTVLITILDARLATSSTRGAQQMQTAFAMAAAAFVVGSSLSLGAVIWRYRDIEADARTRFEYNVEQLTQLSQDRLGKAVYGLRGARGVYAASTSVSADELRAYVKSRSLEEEFPGVRGFGFVQRVARADLPSFLANQRVAMGKAFTVRSTGSAADLYVTTLIEPIDANREDLGSDFGADSVRREALEHAIASGTPTLSGKVILDRGGSRTPGFLYFVPVFANEAAPHTPSERMSALIGVLYAPISARQILSGVASTSAQLLDFQFFDGAALSGASLVFSSANSEQAESSAALQDRSEIPTDRMFVASRAFEVGGHTLTLRATTSRVFEDNIDRITPIVLGFGGVVVSALLGLAAWLLAIGRARAMATARRLTADLDRLAKVAQHTTNAVIITDTERRITWVNEGFTRVTGYSAAEAAGLHAGELLQSDGNDSPDARRLVAATAAGEGFRGEVLGRTKAGAKYWADLDIQPLHDADGTFTGFMAIESDITAQKEASARLETALRETDALLHTVHMHAIVSETNADGILTDVNDAFVRVSGYPREELIGRNPRMLSSAAHPTEFWSNMWNQIGAGRSWRGQICNRAKDGTVFWLDSMIAPFTGSDRSIEKFVTIGIDITASKAAQTELARERQRLENIIDGTSAGTWEWDAATGVFEINARWADMIGYSLAELQPITIERWTAQTHPDDMQPIQEALERHFRGETASYECESRVRHRDGHWVWTLARGRVSARDANGKPLRMSGTHMDITDRKLAEQRVRANEAFLNTAGRVAGVGGWHLDIATGSVHWSDETCRIHDMPVGTQPTLEQALAFYLPESRVIVEQAVTRSMQDGAAFDVEVQTVSAIGRQLWVRAAGVAEFERNVPVRIVGAFQDITRQRQHETSLNEAIERAELASAAKGQFLANMSHEIRTPMNAILGMLTLVGRTELTARQHDYVTKTEGAARSLLGLLNDILDFSKVEAGKMTLDPHPFRLDQVMHDLSVILSANAGAKGIEVLFDIDPALPRALIGDAPRLQQVLINLGGNAIKFTSHGEVVVRLRAVSTNEDRVTMEVSVRDSGIGIAPEHREHIFDGFSQAEASTTRRFGGTGLGLAICKRLVGLMGGELVVDSTPGVGSTFCFSIELPVDRSIEEPSRTGGVLGALRTLIVDDNELAREVLSSMVESLGWKADVAASGAEALAMIAADRGAAVPYHAILMDWQMPGLDGWETSMRVRANTGETTPPVIIMVTAHGREMMAQRTPVEQESLSGFLVKPVTASMLFDAIATARASLAHPDMQRRQAHGGEQRLRGLRILVVEDNAINQQVAQELLESEGAHVSLANDGQIGVKATMAAEPPFDVVLMDVQMPVMDGYTATRAIRSVKGYENQPIVAMTANARASDRAASIEAGMNDHVGKPFELAHLVQTILRHSRRQPSASKSRTDEIFPALPIISVATPVPATADDLPDSLPPFDIEKGLRRLNGKRKLLRKLIVDFGRKYERASVELRRLLADGAQEEAMRLAHTLKGVAGALEAPGLYRTAMVAEAELRDHGTVSATALRALDEELVLTLAASASLSAPVPTAASAPSSTRATAAATMPAPAVLAVRRSAAEQDTVLALCSTLERMLHTNDLSAREYCAELRTALAHSGHDRALLDIQTWIGNFEFAPAAVAVAALVEALSLSELAA